MSNHTDIARAVQQRKCAGGKNHWPPLARRRRPALIARRSRQTFGPSPVCKPHLAQLHLFAAEELHDVVVTSVAAPDLEETGAAPLGEERPSTFGLGALGVARPNILLRLCRASGRATSQGVACVRYFVGPPSAGGQCTDRHFVGQRVGGQDTEQGRAGGAA